MDRALPAITWPTAERMLSLASLIIVPLLWLTVVMGSVVTAQDRTAAGDAYGYWIAWRGGLYDIPWHGPHAFVYTPPIGLALWPFGFLPWPVFYGLFAAAGMLCVVYMVGLPWAGLTLLIFYPALHDIVVGNIHVFIGAAIASGNWWLPLLTKITPGISLTYYLAAREWRRALYAAGVTAVIALATFAIGPFGINLWKDWLTLVQEGIGGTAHPWALVSWPLTIRMPIALLFAVVGGWKRWPWMLPVSVMFALPVLWVSAPALLLAIPRLQRVENAARSGVDGDG